MGTPGFVLGNRRPSGFFIQRFDPGVQQRQNRVRNYHGSEAATGFSSPYAHGSCPGRALNLEVVAAKRTALQPKYFAWSPDELPPGLDPLIATAAPIPSSPSGSATTFCLPSSLFSSMEKLGSGSAR
jgi:hypothetical protein